MNHHVKWKLDIWAVPAKVIADNLVEMNRLRAKLSKETRHTIIRTKHALLTSEGRTPPMSGYHIYCAVVDHGLKSLDEIEKYLRDQGLAV